jgi:hypothetical protein
VSARNNQAGGGTNLPVAELFLDPHNPRLPLSIHGANQEKILQYIKENGELTELARSFADNGYFVQEPVLVVKRKKSGGYTVVEGNRRVTTLKLLLMEDPPPFIDVTLTPARRKQLAAVPAVVLDDEEDLHLYVGFRHISGLQPWSPEAKARYLYTEVEKAAHSRGDDPFRTVGRRVGLQPAHVRQAYLAYAMLHYGADKLGIDVQGITDHAKKRFGVWARAVESPGIRDFVGVGSPTDYREVSKALAGLKQAKLREVVADIGPVSGEPILDDSRNVTTYAKILAHPEALKAKRSEKSLDTAKEIVGRDALPRRLGKLEKTLEALAREVSSLEDRPDEDLIASVEAVRRAAVRLSAITKDLASEQAE